MKNRKKLVSILAGVMAAIMLLTLIFSILPMRAAAASSSEIRKQINALQENRKDIKNQISDLQTQYQQTSDDIADIVARKNVIDQEIGLLHTEIININEQISAYSVLIADQQEELDKAQDRYDELNADCKTRIQAMEEEGTVSYWEVLFKAKDFSDLLDRLNMVEEIASSDTRRLQELSDAAQRVETAQQELAAEKGELEGTAAVIDKDLASEKLAEDLGRVKIPASRLTKETVGGIELITQMAKGQNPAASSTVFETVSRDQSDMELVLLLDEVFDNPLKSETVAWIYDTDYEFLNRENIKKIVVGGERYLDHRVRLLLAGIPEDRIVCVRDPFETSEYVDIQGIQKIYVLHDVNFITNSHKIRDSIAARIREGGAAQ